MDCRQTVSLAISVQRVTNIDTEVKIVDGAKDHRIDMTIGEAVATLVYHGGGRGFSEEMLHEEGSPVDLQAVPRLCNAAITLPIYLA